MHVNQDFEIWPELLSQRLQDFERELEVRVATEELRIPKRVKFQSLEAFLYYCFCDAHEVFWSAFGSVPTIGVGENRISVLATQQLPDGYSQGFSQYVPARNLNRTHDQAMDMTNVGDGGNDCIGDGIDLAWIFSDGEMRQFMDGGFGGRNEPINRRFADPVNSAVGTNLHEQPVLPFGTHCISFNLGDLHEFEPLAWSGELIARLLYHRRDESGGCVQ